MAQMIPERVPTKASKGEQRLFSALENLPEDCVVYYEPRINRRNPDFIVIFPSLGVLIIEVKGWYSGSIVAADNNRVVVRSSDGTESPHDHPDVQARAYKFDLMDYCRTHRAIAGELFEPRSGRFRFPFCHMTVLSNVSDRQLSSAAWNAVFPDTVCATRDTLLRWEALSDGTQIQKELFRYFDPFWTFPRLNEEQLLRLRTIIHPEILIHASRSLPPDVELKALDLQQERNARCVGDGHRIVYGIAGSGKTAVLIARAKLLSEQNPESKILVVCYNVTLRVYLADCLRDYRNVRVTNFHQWASGPFSPGEPESAVGERWLAKLNTGATPEMRKYDTILVDEAQDFAPEWFRCVVAALRDPENGDLLIVHDSNQGVYGDRKICWKDIGIRAQGRTQRNDLPKNYRNTAEILRVATQFARTATVHDDSGDTPPVVNVDPGKCSRRFHAPMLLTFPSRSRELTTVRRIIANLTTGQFEPLPGYKVRPAEIGILYRLKPKCPEFEQLAQESSVTWLNRTRADRMKVCDDNSKLLTIHSSKGLQFRVVIVIGCDDMPTRFPDTDLATERSLFYVALTRAEELLILTHVGTSEFVRELHASQHVDSCDLPESP